jgi:ketosteroid isomerase-like protein
VTDSPNVELVRSIFAAWERGDYGAAEWADPEIEWVFPDGPSPGTWTGLTGLAAGTREFLGAWEHLRAEVDEYRELDDERVLVFSRLSGRGKASQVELGDMQATMAFLVYVCDGKVTRMVRYFDRDRALADLGLAREADASDPPS